MKNIQTKPKIYVDFDSPDGNIFTILAHAENAMKVYSMPAFDVNINEDGKTYRYLINNATFEAEIEIVKKDKETGKVIPASGIGFKVRNTDTGEYVIQHINYPVPMDIEISKGVATFTDILISGNVKYTLSEVNTAERYEVPASQSVAVEWNKTTQVSVYNKLKRGDLQITKTSEDGMVEGIKFRLTGTSLSGEKIDLTATTNSKGIARFDDVLITGHSTYTVTEVDTKDYYIAPAAQSVSIAWNEVTNILYVISANHFHRDNNDSYSSRIVRLYPPNQIAWYDNPTKIIYLTNYADGCHFITPFLFANRISLTL